MKQVTINFLLLIGTIFVFKATNAQNCPYYEIGTSAQGKQTIVNEHNRYRQMVMNGQVPGQPRGKGLLFMRYDDALGQKARVVSNQCKMNHIIAQDGRWSWVGQNLYIEWSSAWSGGQNWEKAIQSWYNEYANYNYDQNGSTNGKAVGHYTQLVWANSQYIGCDFISFYDNSQPSYPYAKLYSCNYGPGGNYNGQRPYERA